VFKRFDEFVVDSLKKMAGSHSYVILGHRTPWIHITHSLLIQPVSTPVSGQPHAMAMPSRNRVLVIRPSNVLRILVRERALIVWAPPQTFTRTQHTWWTGRCRHTIQAISQTGKGVGARWKGGGQTRNRGATPMGWWFFWRSRLCNGLCVLLFNNGGL